MNIWVLIIVLLLSFGLAIRSWVNQRKLEEVRYIKRELRRKKIIYHKDSSSSISL